MVKRILIAIAILGATFSVSAGFVLYFACRDIPPPDVRDLAAEKIEVSSQDNAYTYFCAATNTLYYPTNYVVFKYAQGKTVDSNLLVDVLLKNRQTFELIKRGTACKVYVPPELSDFNALPQISIRSFQEMSYLLAAKAKFERMSGQYSESTDTCISFFCFADLILQQSSCHIMYLLGSGMYESSLTQMRNLIGDPNLPMTEFDRLASLLSIRNLTSESAVHAVKMESGAAFRSIESLYHDVLKKSRSRGALLGFFLFQPNKAKQALADHYRKAIELVPLNYADAKQTHVKSDFGITDNKLKMALSPNLAGRVLCTALAIENLRLSERINGRRNAILATLLSIACHRYKRKEGKYPDSLKDLVPTYLPSVPCDAFDGQPFRYLPKEKLLYSVGKDLKDSKAVWWTEGKQYLKYPDQIYPLGPDAKPLSADTKTVPET